MQTVPLRRRTGFAMTKTLALGAASATAFARSRTMEALVLNRSAMSQRPRASPGGWTVPSLVMPGFLGTPAGIRTISDPVRACFKPSASGWWPVTTLLVLIWLMSAATPILSQLLGTGTCSDRRLTGAAFDIVKCKLGHPRIQLH